MYDQIYSVGMGEYKLGSSPVVMVSSGVGSCVTICLYDRTRKIGAMAHAMLPEMPPDKTSKDKKMRYVDQVVPELVKEMEKLGCDPQNIVAKIAGGANMFTTLGGFSKEIGERNAQKTKELLDKFKIEIVAESTGGTVGRGVEFNLANGVVSIVSKL